MKNITVCFTGHREIPVEEAESVAASLENVIRELIGRGYRIFAAGGALGFDTMAAQTVLRLRDSFPEIMLHLVLPCLTQTRGWSKEDIAVYEQIKDAADDVTYTSRERTRGCMFLRNRQLVERSGVCVCFLRKQTGGTAYTVKYAKANGLEVVCL